MMEIGVQLQNTTYFTGLQYSCTGRVAVKIDEI